MQRGFFKNEHFALFGLYLYILYEMGMKINQNPAINFQGRFNLKVENLYYFLLARLCII